MNINLSINRSTLKSINWVLSSNIALAASQFFTVSFLAKAANPETVGIYSLGLAICSPIFLFLSLKLRNVYVTDTKEEFLFNEYRFLRLVTNCFGIAAIVIFIMGWERSLKTEMVVLLFSINKALEMQSDICHSVFQKKMRMDLVGISIFTRSIAGFIGFVTVYMLSGDLILALLGNTLVHLLVLCFLDKRNLKSFDLPKRKLKLGDLKGIFLLALPLGIATAIGSLMVNVPRYLIEMEMGAYSLGIFSAITYLVIAGNTLLNAISQVYLPKMSNLAAEKDMTRFWKTLVMLNFFGFFLGALLLITVLAIGDWILVLLFSEAYSAFKNLLLIIAGGAIFGYTSVFLGTALTALREYRMQPIMHFITLAIVSACSYMLIKKMGLTGAAWSVFLTYLTQSLGYVSLLLLWKNKKRRGKKHVPI